jgi:hypothetical protein
MEPGKMSETKEQDGTVVMLVDALLGVDMGLQRIAEGLAVVPKDWAADASKTIHLAVAAILEADHADRLQRAMIDYLAIMHSRAVDERDAMRAKQRRADRGE